VKDVINEMLKEIDLIANVMPDYTLGRRRGLTDDETEERAQKALTWMINQIMEENAVQEFNQDVQDAVKRCGRIDFMSTEVVEESGDDADLDRQIWGTNWCWWDAVELMGELKDVFLALPKEQKEALMDKHERSISKGMEAGIMTDWTVVMEAAIECSGLLEDLEMLKEGGDVSDEEEMRMGASEQDED
jgi:hypothetical protein